MSLPGELRVGLASQLDALKWLLSRVRTEDLLRHPRPEKWSAHEHLAHLACYQQRFVERLDAILSSEQPTLRRYRAEEDSEWPRWQAMGTERVLERLETDRRDLLALVTSLSDAQLDRIGVHPTFGAMTIPRWIEFFLLHEAHHIYMMMTLSRQPGAEQT